MEQQDSSKQPILRREMTLDGLQKSLRGSLPDLIGMELISVSQGRLTSRLNVRPDLMAVNGFLHAATIIGLADTTCGIGTRAHLPEGAESFATAELKTNFLGTVRDGAISCEATLEHGGRTLQVWDAVVRDAKTNRRIALFRCTQIILWPKGRAS
jgi:uncharacterized protein (TIGR00369 family)